MATKNPSTANPLITDEANKIKEALITNVNKPNVKRLIGKVKTISIGFKVTFIKPKNKDSHKAAQIPLMATPGTK